MSTKEVLQRARKLITDPRCFLRGRLYNNEGAFCAVGAVATVTGYGPQIDSALAELASLVDPKQLPQLDPCHGTFACNALTNWQKVVHYNNTKGHECVLSLFDEAIARQP